MLILYTVCYVLSRTRDTSSPYYSPLITSIFFIVYKIHRRARNIECFIREFIENKNFVPTINRRNK